MYKMNIVQRICLFSLLLIINNTIIYALESSDIVILILSQENEYNSRMAHKLEQNIIEQSKEINKVYLSHRDYANNGDWTILPLFPKIYHENKNAKWVFVCDEYTELNVERLEQVLEKYNSTEEKWFGHALADEEATIIHHFAFHEDPSVFLYPNIPSGFAITMPLLKKIVKRFSIGYSQENDIEFNIDASHELSLYIWNNSTGPHLIHEPNFCVHNNKNCATYVRDVIKCGPPIPNNSVYFGVKTYHKFHNDRLKFVQKTWAKYAENIQYFSDITDPNIPTMSFNIPNTKDGHCAKTFAIIHHANNILQKNADLKWLIIVDDDTIISPYRLRNFLACYKNTKNLALGQKYGFGVRSKAKKGMNFMTGGAGTVLSKDLVKKIVENDNLCFCPKIDSPDDMALGICLQRLEIKITNSHLFHQARPTDYNPNTLSRNSITFHKHLNTDPMEIYDKWFRKDDEQTFNRKTEL